jgi:Fe-S oxidoreductase
MATYKAEFLAHHYAGRLRPRAHYALGWLPVIAGLITRAGLARPVNALAQAPLLPHFATRAAGVADREIPIFADETLQQWWQHRGGSRPGTRGTVLLWPDTFTNLFHPHIGQAAVRVLEEAGWTVRVPTEPLCCGLTWISTGQLDRAKKVLRRTVDTLAPHIRDGGLVLGLEPSCTAVFRSDAADLLSADLDVKRLQRQTVTLAELLGQHTAGWSPPPMQGVRALAQVHCHQHAVLDDWSADLHLLQDAGVEVERLDSGCCGLAGNFGFERGHLEVSEACAESVLLPALRHSDPDAVVLADGFSCRTQIHQLDSGGREAIHLAELLDRARQGAAKPGGSDLNEGDRPWQPSAAARWAALGAVAAAVTGGGAALRRALR